MTKYDSNISIIQKDDISPNEDYPLGEVPLNARKSFLSTAILLLGFTFFTATMWAGGSLGIAYKFSELIWIIVFGNLLLGTYVAILSYIAYKTGLNTVLMARFAFGDWGSKWVDFILGFTQIGWYAWGTATIAIIFTELIKLDNRLTVLLMVFFGFAFCWTAYIGYRGLEKLSIISVPMMILLIIWSLVTATRDAGGLSCVFGIEPLETMSFGYAITIVFGTFVSGGTNATNWTRFSKSAFIAVFASLIAFFIGNGFMLMVGAYGAYIYQEPDIVTVLSIQGLLSAGIIMLFMNIWTTQDNTVYNFSVAGCNMFRVRNRKRFTVIGAGIGTILAVLGIYEMLVPYIAFLGTFIPPIGGIIIADFFIKHKGYYPKLNTAKLKGINILGIMAYIIGALCAFYSPWIPPLDGIIAGIISYAVLNKLSAKMASIICKKKDSI